MSRSPLPAEVLPTFTVIVCWKCTLGCVRIQRGILTEKANPSDCNMPRLRFTSLRRIPYVQLAVPLSLICVPVVQVTVNGFAQPSEGSFGEGDGLVPATSHKESSHHSGGVGAHLVWGQESNRRRSGDDAEV